MPNVLHNDTSALVEESREHIARIRALLETSNEQARMARQLIAEAQHYIELIEARRIERVLEGAGA
jgi:hypothetical protein